MKHLILIACICFSINASAQLRMPIPRNELSMKFDLPIYKAPEIYLPWAILAATFLTVRTVGTDIRQIDRACIAVGGIGGAYLLHRAIVWKQVNRPKRGRRYNKYYYN